MVISDQFIFVSEIYFKKFENVQNSIFLSRLQDHFISSTQVIYKMTGSDKIQTNKLQEKNKNNMTLFQHIGKRVSDTASTISEIKLYY